MKKILLFLLTLVFASSMAYAATVEVFTRGTGTVTLTASDKIAVFTAGTAKVYTKVGYPNIPGSWRLLTTVTAKEYISSAVTVTTSVRIEADASGAWYSAGTAPTVQVPGPGVLMSYQGAPTADTTVDTLTVDEMLTGIVTVTHTVGATMALTLPLGVAMDTSTDAAGYSDSASFAIGDSFDWSIINLSAAAVDTVTLTANTGHTIVGTAIIQSAHSTTGLLYGNAVIFRTRKTAANTFVTYRIGG